MNPVEFMKPRIRNAVRATLVQNGPWKILGSLLSRSPYFRVQRGWVTEKNFHDSVARIFAKAEVLSGPFQGLRYPRHEARGSALWPKLLGTYELELHQLIAEILQRDYATILDWGSAEGYYLIGLGSHFEKAQLYAIDPDPKARALSQAMAMENDIAATRLHHCEGAVLADFSTQLTTPTLLVCDCEGYEAKLFSRDIERLDQCDVLIECHDHLVPGITDLMRRTLEPTHKISLFQARPRVIEDIPADMYSAEASALSSHDWSRVMSEGRPASMTWLFAERSAAG